MNQSDRNDKPPVTPLTKEDIEIATDNTIRAVEALRTGGEEALDKVIREIMGLPRSDAGAPETGGEGAQRDDRRSRPENPDQSGSDATLRIERLNDGGMMVIRVRPGAEDDDVLSTRLREMLLESPSDPPSGSPSEE